MQDSKRTGGERDALSIGFGLFLVIASALTLAEYAGLIPAMRWGMPTLGLVVGGVVLFNSLSKK